MQQKRIKYEEGQWFAVPLRLNGYGLGIIVRGDYHTKGGLGYFFGPKYIYLPDDEATWEAKPQDAILINWFGDLGIKSGRWPLINSTRPFSREEWPIPKFGQKTAMPGKAYIVEYDQDDPGTMIPMNITVVDDTEITGLPIARLSGGGAIEIELSNLLEL